MNKTMWKPVPEIDFILRNYYSLGILSCGTCANLSFTGGKTGINLIKEHLKKTDKKIRFSRIILACCPEEIMRRALIHHRKDLKQCDALIVLSCAAGIKSANSCRPGIPVLAILDSVGSAAVSCSDPVLARSLCRNCGHCVISYTGGICPVSECPSKRKYGPCSAYPGKGAPCIINNEQECVWTIIEQRGANLEDLKKIKEYHNAGTPRGFPYSASEKKSSSQWMRFFACHAARIQGLQWVIRQFR